MVVKVAVQVKVMQALMAKAKTEFTFQISKDEYLDTSRICTPNLEKNQVNKITEWKIHRSGYQSAGIPSNIAIVRSLQQSPLARRTAMTAGRKRELNKL